MNSLLYHLYINNPNTPLLYKILLNPLYVKKTTPLSLPLPPSPPETPPSVVLRSFFSDKPLRARAQRVVVHTSDLRVPGKLAFYQQKGLEWLQRAETKSYPGILRNPTMGCYVELSSQSSLYAVHITSREAKKIIYRQCYF